MFKTKVQLLHDFWDYQRAKSLMGEASQELPSLFRRFLTATVGMDCLRLTFDSDKAPELGSNWLIQDLNQVESEACPRLKHADNRFDAILCTGLGHLSQPIGLIAEIRRVLKQSGEVWIDVPLTAPYRQSEVEQRAEFWRFTPEGLRVLMADFDEVFCSAYLPAGSALRHASFFYGLKPGPRTDPSNIPKERDYEEHNRLILGTC